MTRCPLSMAARGFLFLARANHVGIEVIAPHNIDICYFNLVFMYILLNLSLSFLFLFSYIVKELIVMPVGYAAFLQE